MTSSRSPWRRPFGITLSRAASSARSAQFSFGQCGCPRCITESWWRKIKISEVFHASSHRDSRSHVITLVIRRKTNRRHMISDHHRRATNIATSLLTATDAILGTHRLLGPGHPCGETAVLLVSELFGNSVRHSGSGDPGETVTVAVRAADSTVRVEVTDRGGPGVPELGTAGRDAEGGRGLQLVAGLAARWG